MLTDIHVLFMYRVGEVSLVSSNVFTNITYIFILKHDCEMYSHPFREHMVSSLTFCDLF